MNTAMIDWTAIGTVITAIATIFLVFVTYQLSAITRKLATVSRDLNQAQSFGQLISLINASNHMVLNDDRNLHAAEELLVHNGIDHSDEAARKRWIAFIFLNQWEFLFLLHKRGDLGEWSQDFWTSSSDQVLERMLHHQWVMDIVETRGYHPKFVLHCKDLVTGIKLRKSKRN